MVQGKNKKMKNLNSNWKTKEKSEKVKRKKREISETIKNKIK